MTTSNKALVLIADYGMGNLGSLANIIKRVGGNAEICSDPDRIARAEKLILPGVGAFDHGMRALILSGLLAPLEEAVLRKQVPVLGVCLGMQLMLEASEEGQMPGLGWIDGHVSRFPSDVAAPRVPHMGWNAVVPIRENRLLPLESGSRRFYFVHSYKVQCNNSSDVLAVSTYGQEFCSVFQKENIYGVQFHPEKSHAYGMEMFKRFLEL